VPQLLQTLRLPLHVGRTPLARLPGHRHPLAEFVADRAVANPTSADNVYTGSIAVGGRLELAPGANQRFVLGPSGTTNSISGATAGRVRLNGLLQIEIAAMGISRSINTFTYTGAATASAGDMCRLPTCTHGGAWQPTRHGRRASTVPARAVPNRIGILSFARSVLSPLRHPGSRRKQNAGSRGTGSPEPGASPDRRTAAALALCGREAGRGHAQQPVHCAPHAWRRVQPGHCVAKSAACEHVTAG